MFDGSEYAPCRVWVKGTEWTRFTHVAGCGEPVNTGDSNERLIWMDDTPGIGLEGVMHIHCWEQARNMLLAMILDEETMVLLLEVRQFRRFDPALMPLQQLREFDESRNEVGERLMGSFTFTFEEVANASE